MKKSILVPWAQVGNQDVIAKLGLTEDESESAQAAFLMNVDAAILENVGRPPKMSATFIGDANLCAKGSYDVYSHSENGVTVTTLFLSTTSYVYVQSLMNGQRFALNRVL